MTRKEAESFLGLSPQSMDNVLKGGHFPSYTNTGDFSEVEVMEWKRLCDQVRKKNSTGDMSLPDCDSDEVDFPLL